MHMNIINILVNLLSKAYAAKVRKHAALAAKHDAAALKLADQALALSRQSDAAILASSQKREQALAAASHAVKVGAKSKQVSEFFTV